MRDSPVQAAGLASARRCVAIGRAGRGRGQSDRPPEYRAGASASGRAACLYARGVDSRGSAGSPAAGSRATASQGGTTDRGRPPPATRSQGRQRHRDRGSRLSECGSSLPLVEGTVKVRARTCASSPVDKSWPSDSSGTSAHPMTRRSILGSKWAASGATTSPPFPEGLAPPPWPEVEAHLTDWLKLANARPAGDEHVLVHMARNHTAFERIHPFRDGNGRVGRLTLNLLVVRHGIPRRSYAKSGGSRTSAPSAGLIRASSPPSPRSLREP